MDDAAFEALKHRLATLLGLDLDGYKQPQMRRRIAGVFPRTPTTAPLAARRQRIPWSRNGSDESTRVSLRAMWCSVGDLKRSV